MGTAAMNSVDRAKAGVASGTLSMSRMVGGTFGVAVMGALITTIGRSKIDSLLPHVPASTRATIANSLAGGGRAPGGHAPTQVIAAVHEAFISALSTGLGIGATVTLVGAVLAWTLISRVPAAPPAPEPDAAPEPELTLA